MGHYPEPHEFGYVEDPSAGCTIDGIDTLCSIRATALNLGALRTEWDQVGANGVLRKNSKPIEPLGLGLFVWWLPDDARGNDKTLDPYLVNVYYPQNSSSQKTPCTFNINLKNRSGVPLSKKDLETIEKKLNEIFESGGHRATLNNPNAATTPDFNYNLTVYNNFPKSYPASARFDNKTVGYTRLTRQIPDSPYPSIYFPGPIGGVSVDHIRDSYGAKYTRPAALAPLVAAIGVHEMIAHYLLMEPGHLEQYASGITAEAIGDPTKPNWVISAAVKEQLDTICKTRQLPK